MCRLIWLYIRVKDLLNVIFVLNLSNRNLICMHIKGILTQC
ncbi:unnamed protein product [Larinioides sclopetarius]|uniref:Uncharacterized protein n=1 Tax=Larinioides sclopetarius TaxID=280406 RepID=A0AAV2AZR0_9ARAC